MHALERYIKQLPILDVVAQTAAMRMIFPLKILQRWPEKKGLFRIFWAISGYFRLFRDISGAISRYFGVAILTLGLEVHADVPDS